MKTRIISGLIMVPFLAVLIFGGLVLKLLCIFVAVCGLYEFYKAFHQIDVKPSFPLGILSIAALYGISFLKWPSEVYLLWICLCLGACLLYLFDMKRHSIPSALVTFAGMIYIVFFSFHIVLIDGLKGFEQFVWMTVIASFVTDIGAYFTGYYFGRNKLCPAISPKKTVEGAIGGTLCAVIAAGIFGLLFTEGLFFHCLAMGLLASITSQLGDLSASVFKRHLGIKDYGNLIPGHGGILDRFDSFLFAAPTVYYYLIFAVV